MSISPQEVDRIAKLARLEFTEPEKQKLESELSAILDYVGQVQQLQSKVSGHDLLDLDAVNLMRDDVAEPMLNPEEFLTQAPARQGNFIKVKSILD